MCVAMGCYVCVRRTTRNPAAWAQDGESDECFYVILCVSIAPPIDHPGTELSPPCARNEGVDSLDGFAIHRRRGETKSENPQKASHLDTGGWRSHAIIGRSDLLMLGPLILRRRIATSAYDSNDSATFRTRRSNKEDRAASPRQPGRITQYILNFHL